MRGDDGELDEDPNAGINKPKVARKRTGARWAFTSAKAQLRTRNREAARAGKPLVRKKYPRSLKHSSIKSSAASKSSGKVARKPDNSVAAPVSGFGPTTRSQTATTRVAEDTKKPTSTVPTPELASIPTQRQLRDTRKPSSDVPIADLANTPTPGPSAPHNHMRRKGTHSLHTPNVSQARGVDFTRAPSVQMRAPIRLPGSITLPPAALLTTPEARARELAALLDKIVHALLAMQVNPSAKRRVYCVSPACKEPFSSVPMLRRHMAVHFELESPCEYCGKMFSYRQAMSSKVRHWMSTCPKVPDEKKRECEEKR